MRRALTLLIVLAILLACQDVRSPAQQAADWWAQRDRAAALCVIHYESGGDPHQISSTGDYGVMQIHRATWRRSFEAYTGKPWDPAIFDPTLNGQFAHDVIFAGSGWSAWSTHRRCGV